MKITDFIKNDCTTYDCLVSMNFKANISKDNNRIAIKDYVNRKFSLMTIDEDACRSVVGYVSYENSFES